LFVKKFARSGGPHLLAGGVDKHEADPEQQTERHDLDKIKPRPKADQPPGRGQFSVVG